MWVRRTSSRRGWRRSPSWPPRRGCVPPAPTSGPTAGWARCSATTTGTASRSGPGPWPCSWAAPASARDDDLLQRPAVAVGVREVDEPAPGLLVDALALDVALAEVGQRCVGVLDHHLDELRRAGRHHVESDPEADRAGRARWRDLHEPQLGADGPVVVDVPPDPLAVEVDRPVDVLHRQGDELDPEVHGATLGGAAVRP